MKRSELSKYIYSQLSSFLTQSEADRITKYIVEDFVSIDMIIDQEFIKLIDKLILRLKNGEPYQYVSNRADFYGLHLYVDDRVLIPRPETEELVFAIINFIKENEVENHKTLLDIGTGSGCIALALKSKMPHLDISAIDISEGALDVAKINAKANSLDANFFSLDILDMETWDKLSIYDIIVSNPPYIPHRESGVMGIDVIAHEPHLALFTEDIDGLVFYHQILQLCSDHLSNMGVVFLELNEYHADKVKDIYQASNLFATVRLIEDMQGKPRMLIASISEIV